MTAFTCLADNKWSLLLRRRSCSVFPPNLLGLLVGWIIVQALSICAYEISNESVNIGVNHINETDVGVLNAKVGSKMVASGLENIFSPGANLSDTTIKNIKNNIIKTRHRPNSKQNYKFNETDNEILYVDKSSNVDIDVFDNSTIERTSYERCVLEHNNKTGNVSTEDVKNSLNGSVACSNSICSKPGLESGTCNRTKIYIGGLFDLTGSRGETLGQSELTSARLAVDDVNRENILPGYELVLLHNDTRVCILLHFVR